MRRILGICMVVALVTALTGVNAQAQDKTAYERRSIARYIELFTWLDSDRDGTVTRLETQGDLSFTPVFDDIDINRDGIVTKAELDRYLELQYGMRRG